MGAALGRPDRAAEILRETDDLLAAERAEHPELEGVSYLNSSVPGDDGSVVVFAEGDQRTHTLEGLGLVGLPEVTELWEANEQVSSFVVGPEELIALRPAIFVTVADDATWETALEAHPSFAAWDSVNDGRAAVLTDAEVGLAYSTATPLGLAWGMDVLVETLSQAALAARG